jgi:hypothetical protein
MFNKILNEKSSGSQINLQKNYEKPELTLLGDVRGITLGGSISGQESGERSVRLPVIIRSPQDQNQNPFDIQP